MKKLLCVVLGVVLAVSLLCINVSACPYGHPSTYLSYSCNHLYADAIPNECPAAGRPFWVPAHPVNCLMMEVLCYTSETCSHPGCVYNAPNESHHCSTYHTGVTYTAVTCPYTSDCPNVR